MTHDGTHGRTQVTQREPDGIGRYHSDNRSHNWSDNNNFHNNGFMNNMNGNNNDHNNRYNSGSRYNRVPSRYGSTKHRTDFGLPLPSRHIVIERVRQERTKEDMRDYI